MIEEKYYYPHGLSGIGSDVKWCNKPNGRKKCLLCYHYAELEEWLSSWHWHYLTHWGEWPCDNRWLYRSQDKRGFKIYSKYTGVPTGYSVQPRRYSSTGISEYELLHLLKNGCKSNKKCRCVTIIQRASWYCPDCWKMISDTAKYQHKNIHDIITTDRSELKMEMLTLMLAGIS